MFAAFGAMRGDAVVVTSQGASSGLVWELAEHPATIYSMELGYASAVAMGIAWGVPERRVVAFEGDGSLFAETHTLGTIARYPPPNLTIVVVANGVWGTGDGSVETATARVARWPDLAVACGWPPERVLDAREAEPLRDALRRALSEPGPWFVVARTERGPEDRSGNTSRKELRESRNDAVESIDATRRSIRTHIVRSS